MLIIIEIIVLLALLFFMFIWPKLKLNRNAKVVGNEEFEKKLADGQLIDIREASLYRQKHILGARNLPENQIDMSLNALSKNKPVLIYETTRPTKAAKVAKKLKKAGITEIYVLKDGLNAWQGKTKQG
ncbi:rhodanese-like domain-containing protein [Lactococcus termiticola]|uniref:Rhodanese-like domain protein n=1 Tax=Lactococcus termiticola TaxID=2169526 RepID=A0A2R5HIC8_9LACT|nr:rhodanese-like domain-containing protein [Lactococcus termiticola]GBG96050.1 rhodanese-like domain protein [Lactococcus termiticola]